MSVFRPLLRETLSIFCVLELLGLFQVEKKLIHTEMLMGNNVLKCFPLGHLQLDRKQSDIKNSESDWRPEFRVEQF